MQVLTLFLCEEHSFEQNNIEFMARGDRTHEAFLVRHLNKTSEKQVWMLSISVFAVRLSAQTLSSQH